MDLTLTTIFVQFWHISVKMLLNLYEPFAFTIML